ncbi:MAG TPA: CapA family protein [Frankiaceae bacterium]|nr:CapA family protein [Frankiaceae bacterium]
MGRRGGPGIRSRKTLAAGSGLLLSAVLILLGACGSSSPPGASSGRSRTPAPGTSTPAAPGAGTPGSAEVTVAFTGDLLLHAPVYQQAAVDGRSSGRSYDFRPMFARVKPLLSAPDLAICHQETPLLPTDAGVSGYPVFHTPPEIAADAKDAGFDGCSTASNHSFDGAASGVASTLTALDRVHLAHVGTARSAQERAKPETHDVRGVQVALLDYTYGLNGERLPSSQPYLVNLINVPAILHDAAAARAAGAKIVVVQMHWGTENQSAPTAEQRAQARQLLASPDIDAIVGGHVHVPQPVERIAGKYVVYGVGNFLSNQSPACCPPASQDGVIVTLHLTDAHGPWAVSRVSFTPTYVDRANGYVILPVAGTMADRSLRPDLRKQLADSWRRTTTTMLSAHPPGVAPDQKPPGL